MFGTLAYAAAFKPALVEVGELCKKHPVCTKIRLFEIQNRKFFLGRGHSPLPRPLPQWGGRHSLPTLHPLRRLRRLDPRAYRSHTSFLRKRSLVFNRFFVLKIVLFNKQQLCQPCPVRHTDLHSYKRTQPSCGNLHGILADGHRSLLVFDGYLPLRSPAVAPPVAWCWLPASWCCSIVPAIPVHTNKTKSSATAKKQGVSNALLCSCYFLSP